MSSINKGGYDNTFRALYPQRGAFECQKRYVELIQLFKKEYCNEDGGMIGSTAIGIKDTTTACATSTQKDEASSDTQSGVANRAVIISAPGRTEVCGNHTDHQHGNVLAAAIDLDIICFAVINNDNIIRVKSAGYPSIAISLDDTSKRENERGDAAALIRGLADWFIKRGIKICGFNAYTSTEVLVGSGLSSSAAFEVLIGSTINTLFGGELTPLEIAIAGQFAENQYFGKPCGLMDQTASSVGGFVQIDFNDPKNPIVTPVQCDLSTHGLRLCVVNTKGSHANLIGEYASIPAEMLAVASCFGKHFLRDVSENDFYSKFAKIREELTRNLQNPIAADRALLRAMHFFYENKLVPEAAEALRTADIDHFLDCITRSGQSSFNKLQNIFSVTRPGEQSLSIALALSESILLGAGGAWRVHGGGFAGTIIAFVPEELHDRYKLTLEAVFGAGSCITLAIRQYGGVEVTPVLKR